MTLAKMKDKERILKAGEEETVTYKGVPVKLSADLKRSLTGKKELERSIQNHERQRPISKITLFIKALI